MPQERRYSTRLGERIALQDIARIRPLERGKAGSAGTPEEPGQEAPDGQPDRTQHRRRCQQRHRLVWSPVHHFSILDRTYHDTAQVFFFFFTCLDFRPQSYSSDVARHEQSQQYMCTLPQSHRIP